jgi:hypothetical protein
MSNFQLTTPVAFIIFNRPDTTEKVFSEIAKAEPKQLLVIGDGPRVDRPGEEHKVAATRAIIDRVDWDCEVVTNYSDSNLGCKQRVSSGIDWVFELAEEAIILEDDCLPDPSFFKYCQELLERYRHDQRVGMISGDNFQFGNRRNDDSYYFSKYVHIWGWASWRDRWSASYDVKIAKWPFIRDEGWLVDMVGNNSEVRYWQNIFERVYRGEIDTWDYQWVFANWAERRLSVIPSVNLISNIGFGGDATHTQQNSIFADMNTDEIHFPLRHPQFMVRNATADTYTCNVMFRRPFWKRIASKFRSYFIK